MFRGFSQMGAMREAAVAAHRRFDVVLSPTAPITAFPAELASPTDDPARPLEHICFTVAYNMSEQPAASINCGWTRAGLPIGLQIAGKRHDDLGVLQVAAAWEAMRPAPAALARTARRRDVSGLSDAHGIPTSTASQAALEASDIALWRMLSFYGTPLDDLDAAIAADPAWLLPRVMKAGFLLNLTEPSLVAEAKAILDAAEPLAAGANERERAHLAALRRVERGDWQGAAEDWGALLRAEPRDVLALQWALLFDFYCGDAEALRERAAAVLPAWSEADPLYPYVLGHHAFGLEESGRYAEAEAVGRRALARSTRVPWAIHAVAHVMEMQSRHAEGAVWMATWRPFWGVGNGFAGHLGWHEALFALEARDHAKALEVFDLYLNAEANEITLQRVDAASLLWRLDLHGAEVGDRWQRLLAGWALDDPAAAGSSAFNDVHALLALLGAGERDQAARWMSASLANAARERPVEPRGVAGRGRAADARARRLRRRPLRRRRPAAPAAARRRRRAPRRQPCAARRDRPDAACRRRPRRQRPGGPGLAGGAGANPGAHAAHGLVDPGARPARRTVTPSRADGAASDRRALLGDALPALAHRTPGSNRTPGRPRDGGSATPLPIAR